MSYGSRKKGIKICILSGLVLQISIIMACTSSEFSIWMEIGISVYINLSSKRAFSNVSVFDDRKLHSSVDRRPKCREKYAFSYENI